MGMLSMCINDTKFNISDDECSGYCCSSGQCVAQRADCSSQETSSDNSDSTPNGTLITDLYHRVYIM